MIFYQSRLMTKKKWKKGINVCLFDEHFLFRFFFFDLSIWLFVNDSFHWKWNSFSFSFNHHFFRFTWHTHTLMIIMMSSESFASTKKKELNFKKPTTVSVVEILVERKRRKVCLFFIWTQKKRNHSIWLTITKQTNNKTAGCCIRRRITNFISFNLVVNANFYHPTTEWNWWEREWERFQIHFVCLLVCASTSTCIQKWKETGKFREMKKNLILRNCSFFCCCWIRRNENPKTKTFFFNFSSSGFFHPTRHFFWFMMTMMMMMMIVEFINFLLFFSFKKTQTTTWLNFFPENHLV